MTVFLVLAVRPLVLPSILPDVLADAVHNSFEELSLKAAAVSPLEDAMATHLVLLPLARVPGAVRPEVDAIALLNALREVTVVVATVAPYLNSVAGLFFADECAVKILEHIVFVELALAEHAEPVLAVLLPETLEVFTVKRSEDADAEWVAVDPEALECTLVRPN